jgi:hypothetical protein
MEEPDGEAAEDDLTDDLGQMLEDHRKLLYPGCKDGLKKLGSTLELLQWKAMHGVSDKGFGQFLKHLKNMLPKDNELPTTTYKAKQLVCPEDWRYRRYMHVPMTASSTAVMSMRIWMHAPYTVHCSIRSGEMILGMSRGSVIQGREFLPRSCGTLL